MDAPNPSTLQLRQSDWEAMRAALARAAPEEACGLLAGRVACGAYVVESVIPMTNVLHSPVRYRIDPLEQLRAFERIDAAGQELVGIYHSHPHGPDHPSPTDLAEAYYPEAAYLIWWEQSGEWACGAFNLQNSEVRLVDIRILA